MSKRKMKRRGTDYGGGGGGGNIDGHGLAAKVIEKSKGGRRGAHTPHLKTRHRGQINHCAVPTHP